MSDTSRHTDQPVNPSVAYEFSDVSVRGVLTFGFVLALVLAACSLLLWWLFGHYRAEEAARKQTDLPWTADERAGSVTDRENTRPRLAFPDLGESRSGLDPKPRLEGLEPRAPEHDVGRIRPGTASQQRAQEETYLAQLGWIDRDKKIVHIPIEQAMKQVAGQLPARAGEVEEEYLAAPSRSSSGRMPRGGKP